MRALIALLLISVLSASAQQLKKLRDVKLPAKVERISVDRLGGFYSVNDCGITKYNPEGKSVGRYNPRGCTPTELVEAWGNARVFAFQKSHPRFIVFNPEMEILDFIAIDPSFAVEPQLATPAPDMSSFWILDIDKSIKKIDGASHTVSFETDTLKHVLGNFVYMREYQNMLFLLEPNTGILILNKLGQPLSKIEATNISYFSFAGEDLYYLKDNQVFFHDIFSKDTYSISVEPGFKFVVATDERLVLIKNGIAAVFAFTPRQ